MIVSSNQSISIPQSPCEISNEIVIEIREIVSMQEIWSGLDNPLSTCSQSIVILESHPILYGKWFEEYN